MANKPQTEQEPPEESSQTTEDAAQEAPPTEGVDPEAEAAAATEAVEGDDLPAEPSQTMEVDVTDVVGMSEQTPEQQTMELPPALQDAGLKGVIGVTSGQYTLPSGSSFAVSPGQAYAVSAEDATALVDQGAGVALDDVQPPS